MQTLTEHFKRLGFNAEVRCTRRKGEKPYYRRAYIKDLSKNTSLIVESSLKKGYSTYRFTFYKTTFLGGGRRYEKVYLENASPVQVLRKVTQYVKYLERRS